VLLWAAESVPDVLLTEDCELFFMYCITVFYYSCYKKCWHSVDSTNW